VLAQIYAQPRALAREKVAPTEEAYGSRSALRPISVR
jgi:hypothetical protein